MKHKHAQHFDDFRIFPRLVLGFMAYMLWEFHQWFTQDGTIVITDMMEWTLVGYATVIGAYVGFFKFYMDSGKTND